MPKLFNRALQISGEDAKVGTPNITVLEYDSSGHVTRAKGATVPSDNDAGYAVGCIFIDTGSGDATTLYVNEGSTSLANFDAYGAAASGASTALSNLASVAINTALISDTDDTDDLGSSAKQWKDLYINGVANIDSVMGDIAELGGATNYIKVAATGVLTMEGTATIDGVASGNLLDKSAAEVVTGGWDFTTAAVEIKADDLKLGFGTSGISDSYILFNGTSLMFYDTEIGTAKSLIQLFTGTQLNPSVNGDLSIADGKFNWTDAVDEIAGTWTFSSIGAGSDIDIVTSTDSGESIHIIANSLTTGQVIDIETTNVGAAGALIYLDVTEAGHNATGNFIQCFNGSADVFEVGKYGAVVIKGSATGTDILTATAGDITLTSGDCTLTDGDYVISEGKITVSTVTDETSFVKRNLTGATSAVVEIEATHTGDVGSALLIDHKGTGNAKALEITHAGDLAAIDISASAARTGNVINIPMANQVAQTAIDITGAATGTASEGIIHVDVTGALVGNAIRVDSTGANAAGGQLIYALSAGNQAAATNGICAYFQDTGAAQVTSYAVYISSTSNEALHVDTGKVLVDETLQATGGIITLYDGSVDLSATPAGAELDGILGANATAGTVAVIKDLGGTPVYLVVSDGADNWYVALTKAV